MSTLRIHNAPMDPLLIEIKWPLVTKVQSSFQKHTLTKVLGLIPGDVAWKKTSTVAVFSMSSVCYWSQSAYAKGRNSQQLADSQVLYKKYVMYQGADKSKRLCYYNVAQAHLHKVAQSLQNCPCQLLFVWFFSKELKFSYFVSGSKLLF